MTDIQLYTKLADLPTELKKRVSDYIDSLMAKDKTVNKPQKRIAGLGKGLISMKDNFNDPIEGFEDYLQ
ncbi:type II toxin-antitoxin system VapB family antitoxin [Pedobacter sp. 22163]|uniref:type II toxin-antitoxin system VapB family antitoxin n=1 Tax=Pedobacter sp. 22163 TaxID=3453883 RepID=UPI003F8579D0